MNGTAARFLRLGVSLSGLMILGWVLTGQAAPPAQEGLPTDWSHRHLIFSQPATYEKVNKITSEPRYWQQFFRDNVKRTLPADAAASGDATSMIPGSEGFWSESMGSGASVGAGNYPAKYAFQINSASCSDYVAFSTGLAGTAGQASIVAYSNLYSGCGTGPTTFWAFNTRGTILTSPAIAPGGSQVAFVQTAGGLGTLVLLKWAAGSGTVGAPTTLTAVGNGAYRTCTAPCMTTIDLRDQSNLTTDDTTSSVFPDYTNDTIWVGGARAWLHKITGVFRGTPAEVRGGGFPAHMTAGTALSSPVYDPTSGFVFVGDYSGFLNKVSATGAVTRSGQVDFGTGLVAGPIVDSTAGKVYVFSSDDNIKTCTGNTVPCAAVYRFNTGFAAGAVGTHAVVGASQVALPNPNPLYEGGFDSAYLTSGTATGSLYVCGDTAGAPTLYRITVTGGALGAVAAGPQLASATTGCSPVSDIPNPNATGGTAEWIFASPQNSGVGNNCAAGGCLMNFNVQPWKAATVYAIGQEILDTHFQIQVVRVAGTSGAAASRLGCGSRREHERWRSAAMDKPGSLRCCLSHLAAEPRLYRWYRDSRL